MTKKKIDKPTSLEDVIQNMDYAPYPLPNTPHIDNIGPHTQRQLEGLYSSEKEWSAYFKPDQKLVFTSAPCQSHDAETQKEEARVFESGMKRDNDDNKPYVHNLTGYVRLRFGYLTRMGARNYGDGNFLKGSPKKDAISSADRHWAKYLDGDNSEDNLSAMIFNIQLIMLEEKKEGILADHYFKPVNKG
jgi:dATP/dGTP diphosphohydrolase